jgi:serine/threonine protein kinase
MIESASVDTAQFPPGQMLDGKYRIDRLLSIGGMGAVYVGMHTMLKKTVAIKVLRTELVGAVEMVERFQREAVAASAIGHENIVTITDMGKTEGGVAFLVMEYLEGRNLEDAIQEAGPFASAIACDVACEILAGVAAAHRAGIVHRDLKPANVFMARRSDGREAVKVLDFGIAILSDSEQPEHRLTMTGMVLGTPHYMAPEQARGDKEITEAVDIYAVGVMLYEMLCKRVPYDGENYNVLIYQVLSGEYSRPSVHRPDLPPGLEEIILKAMSLKQWDRFLTAEEFIEALEPYCSGQRSSPSLRIPAQSPSRRHKRGVTATAETLSSPITGEGQALGAAAAHEATLTPGTAVAPEIAHAAGTVHPGSATAEDFGQTLRQPPGPSETGLAGVRGSPLRLVIPLLILPIVAGVVLALVWPGDEAATTTAPAVASPAPQPEPAATEVVIDFMVTPPDATVLVAGRRVSGGKLTLPADTAALPLRVEADGYETYEGELVPDQSRTVTVPPLVQKAAVGLPGAGDGDAVEETERTGERSRRGDRRPDKGDKRDKRGGSGNTIITDDPYSN